MVRSLLTSAAICALAVAAGSMLNPSPEKHRAEISQVVSSRSEFATLLQLGRVTAFFSDYHSLGVASYTTVNDRVVSVGAFGVVYVLDRSPAR